MYIRKCIKTIKTITILIFHKIIYYVITIIYLFNVITTYNTCILKYNKILYASTI